MLVTFRTKAYSDIMMFGDVAVELLKLMGHSGTVPGALLARDVPAALDQLKSALAAQKRVAPSKPAPSKKEEAEEEKEKEPPVDLSLRAVPLIELLEAAAAAKADVMWDQ
ncbi:MAG: DUF1840 domain-containing protein [Candidatus Competibacteraceae bacterium]|nr:DUF1840 domain-containing protein [Candidatus Competibacteraceae bacterium]